jgi:hypothetical protein
VKWFVLTGLLYLSQDAEAQKHNIRHHFVDEIAEKYLNNHAKLYDISDLSCSPGDDNKFWICYFDMRSKIKPAENQRKTLILDFIKLKTHLYDGFIRNF